MAKEWREEYARDAIDKRNEELEAIREAIYSYELEFNYYLEAMFSEGLDKRDIKPLEEIFKSLYKIDYQIKRYMGKDIREDPLDDAYMTKIYKAANMVSYEKYLLRCLTPVMIDYDNLIKELKSHYVKKTFTEFVNEEASLLHLVSTNNHSHANIKKVSDDAYLFCCQFHNDRTPSMRVNTHSNIIRCYGCGYLDYRPVDYIMVYEELDKYHALALLCAIYKIEFKNNPYNEKSELVKKYTNAYALAKYKKRLTSGYLRASHKNKTFNNYLAIKNYEREFSLLERIKGCEYIAKENKKDNKKLVYQINDEGLNF